MSNNNCFKYLKYIQQLKCKNGDGSSFNMSGENVFDKMFLSLLVDSDSDNFQSLKKVPKPNHNGTAKLTKSDAGGARPGAKEGLKSPVKPSSTQGKSAVKFPVTPKSAPPPQPKQTPTSVMDYFGSTAVQRSDKKLVASVKRKAVSSD